MRDLVEFMEEQLNNSAEKKQMQTENTVQETTSEAPAVPTQEQVEKEMTCEHCHSKLVSKAELTGAVQFIHATLSTFRDRVDNLMGMQAKRVLKAIIESPLEKEVASFTTKEAQKCFELGIAINSAKYVLFQGSKNHYDELAGDIQEQMENTTEGTVAPMVEETQATQEGNENG